MPAAVARITPSDPPAESRAGNPVPGDGHGGSSGGRIEGPGGVAIGPEPPAVRHGVARYRDISTANHRTCNIRPSSFGARCAGARPRRDEAGTARISGAGGGVGWAGCGRRCASTRRRLIPNPFAKKQVASSHRDCSAPAVGRAVPLEIVEWGGWLARRAAGAGSDGARQPWRRRVIAPVRFCEVQEIMNFQGVTPILRVRSAPPLRTLLRPGAPAGIGDLGLLVCSVIVGS